MAGVVYWFSEISVGLSETLSPINPKPGCAAQDSGVRVWLSSVSTVAERRRSDFRSPVSDPLKQERPAKGPRGLLRFSEPSFAECHTNYKLLQ